MHSLISICFLFLASFNSEATRLAEAWNEELSFGGLTSQWAEEFEADLARMEAELDGLHVRTVNEVRPDIFVDFQRICSLPVHHKGPLLMSTKIVTATRSRLEYCG
ncbi:DnaJ subfamily A member 5 [Fasciola gigantica]|uniref:DnaJ subfamily A member 5 n=1 Tax=Fasciola gigantica TaxID=46835 RepID=A0A504YN73_FASGI|nr:DnaJ subfamily A member 5 [Fasciola gigantica]